MGLRCNCANSRPKRATLFFSTAMRAEALTHLPISPTPGRESPGRRGLPAGAGAGAGQEGRDAGAVSSIASRANSSSIPARPSAAAISSPIWSNSTVYFGPQPGAEQAKAGRGWSRTMVRSTTSKRSLAALAARAHWLTVEWRSPKYAPELNEIEPVWRDLKAHHLAHQTFTDVAALDQAIHDAVIDLNRERIPDPLAMPRISA